MAEDPIIDPNTGMFNTGTVYHSPGPGGAGSSLGGVLDFLNAFKGQDLANEARAKRHMESAGYAEQHLQPSTYADESELQNTVGTATGMTPQGVGAMSQKMPAMEFRSKVAALQQQYPEGIPSQELEAASLQTGQNVPGLYGYMGRQVGAERGEKKDFSTVLQKEYANALTQADTDREARRKAADVMLPAYGDRYSPVLEAWVRNGTDEPTPMALARKNTTVAKGEQATGAAALSWARGEYLQKTMDPDIQVKLARVGLLDVQQKLATTHEEIEKIKAANGGVLPEAQKPAYMRILAELDQRVQAQAAQGALGLKPDPKITADLQKQIRDVQSHLGPSTAPAATAKKYASEQAFADDWAKDHDGAPPSAEVRAKAKTLGYF